MTINNKNSLKYLIIYILLICSINVYSQRSLFGLWKGVDRGEVGFLRLDDKGVAIFSFYDETLGGEDFMVNGVSAKLTYLVDSTKNPINLDFIVTNLDSNLELGRLLCIVEFIDDLKIKLRINFEGPVRPVNFMPVNNEETLILDKIE